MHHSTAWRSRHSMCYENKLYMQQLGIVIYPFPVHHSTAWRSRHSMCYENKLYMQQLLGIVIYPFPVHHSTAWRSRQSHFDLQHSYCTKELCHTSDDVLFGLIRHWTSLVSGTLTTGYKFTRLGRIWGREYVSGESFDIFVVVVQSGKKEHIVQHTIYNTGLHYVTMTTKHSEQ